MKLIIENWNNFLKDEKVDEGVTAAAKIAAMLAGMGLNTTAPEDMDTGMYDSDTSTHQVEYEPEQEPSKPGIKINTLIDNKDGTYSIVTPVNPDILKVSNSSMLQSSLDLTGRRALAQALTGKTTTSQNKNSKFKRQVVDGSFSIKTSYLDSNFKPVSIVNSKNIKYIVATGKVL